MTENPVFLVTCEHGGNRIPGRYAGLFSGQEALLASHRGWDPGALWVARAVARALDARLFFSQVSRLLVELNRSLHHPDLFSEISRSLPPEERARVLKDWYEPYRNRVTDAVGEEIAAGRSVVHLSVHSFTPVLDGRVRAVEVGLLYDPSRPEEKAFCRTLRDALRKRFKPGADLVRIRLNQPYRGRSDGFTTWLRKRFFSGYLGIELEISQGLIGVRGEGALRFRRAILEGLRELAGK